MANTYHIGDRVRCTFDLEDAAGAKVDPSVITGWFIDPAGTQTTYVYGTDSELVRSAQGVYYFDVDVDAHGRWFYGMYSTGTGKAASQDYEMAVAKTRRATA